MMYRDRRERFAAQNLGMLSPPPQFQPPMQQAHAAIQPPYMDMAAPVPIQQQQAAQPPSTRPPTAIEDAIKIRDEQPVGLMDALLAKSKKKWADKKALWDGSDGLFQFAQANNQYNKENGLSIEEIDFSDSRLMAKDPDQYAPYRTYGGGF